MKWLMGSAAIALSMVAAPVMAQADDARLQVKVLGTGVLPDGKIKRLDTDIVGLPAGTQTAASDNYVPTIAVEYFFAENFSLEAICCLTQHDVDATSGLPGAELVSNGKLIPATITAKYHFDAGGIKPYVGAGATYFLWLDADPGAATLPLGVTNTTLSGELGFVLQAGADIPMGKDGFALSLDAKRYFVDTTARWFAGNTLAIETKHELDPWVLSAGVAYRF